MKQGDMASTSRFLDPSTPPHIVTLALMAGLAAMTMSIFLPSLPAIALEYDAPYALVQLLVPLYLGCVAILQVVIGPLSDKFGRRSVTLTSLWIFIAASLGCVFAPTIEVLIVFRMVQASAATGIVLGRAIVRDMVEADKAASMIGYVTMGMSLVPMIAPAIGGIVEQNFGWRMTFGFMALCGFLVLLLCWRDQGETQKGGGLPFSQQLKETPELLQSFRFWAYSLAAAFSSGAFFSFLGGAPFVASEVYNQPPASTGLFFGVPAIGYLVGNMVSGMISEKIGVNRMITAGSVILFLGMGASLLLTYAGFGSVYLFFGFCTFVGLGNGLVLPSANAGLLSVRPRLAGTASGIGGALMIGGGAALSALAGALLTPGSGPYPLQWIMFICSLFSILAVVAIYRRERTLAMREAAN